MDELLSIGDFAAECGLSPKMLRSYAAAGLLAPAAVDSSTGYRYYSTGQLHQARVIALLRRAEVPVEAIGRFFDDPDNDQLDRWEQQISEESTGRRQALAEARAALALGPTASPPRRSDASPSSKRGEEMSLTFTTGTATARGRRDTNEDAMVVNGAFCAIADGIGGLQNGEVASALALETINAAFAKDSTIAGLLRACAQANDALQRSTDGDATLGTTVTALAGTDDLGLVVVNVGDSRLYRLRGGRLELLTRDHTVTADMVREHELNAEDAESHPHRKVLSRAVGVGTTVEVDYSGVQRRPGDRFLLCTDGLYDSLSFDDLKAALAPDSSPQQSADQLVAQALAKDPEDNLTAVVID